MYILFFSEKIKFRGISFIRMKVYRTNVKIIDALLSRKRNAIHFLKHKHSHTLSSIGSLPCFLSSGASLLNYSD